MGARTQGGQGGGKGEVRALFPQKKPKAMRFWSILTLALGRLGASHLLKFHDALRASVHGHPASPRAGGPRAGASGTARGLTPAGGWERLGGGARKEGGAGVRGSERRGAPRLLTPGRPPYGLCQAWDQLGAGSPGQGPSRTCGAPVGGDPAGRGGQGGTPHSGSDSSPCSSRGALQKHPSRGAAIRSSAGPGPRPGALNTSLLLGTVQS